MARIAAVLIIICFLLPSAGFADTRIFLGTRTGWARTSETFTHGKYKDTSLFLVIGTTPTTTAIKRIWQGDIGSTIKDDVSSGSTFFNEQLKKSGSSFSKNASGLVTSVGDLAADPFREIANCGLLTPARIVGKTVVNTLKIAWYAVILPFEPVARTGAGALVLSGSPFVKPLKYAGKYTLLTGVTVYGYTSSAAGGAVLLGATGGVFVLDIATSPFVSVYEIAAE